jgi:hypothetical protein
MIKRVQTDCGRGKRQKGRKESQRRWMRWKEVVSMGDDKGNWRRRP